MDTKVRVTTDPVCGMSVDRTSLHRQTYEGTEYFFCSEACRERFETHPERYAQTSD
jgi:Cu+-exporting ATPase